MRAVVVTTHPIQYQAPLFRKLAARIDLHVIFMMQQTARGHAASGFNIEFEWDMPLLDGYPHSFAENVARDPTTDRRNGIVLRGHEQLLKSLNPEVVMVMGWFPQGYLQMLQWTRRSGVPSVCRGEANLLSGRSLLKRLGKAVLFRRFLGQFNAFAVIGRRNREFYLHYGVPEEKLFDAPYSIDTEFFEEQFRKFRREVRRPGRWRIGFSGKLIPKKRPLDLIYAVAASKSPQGIEAAIIGDGPLRGDLERASARLNVKVDLRGFLNQRAIVPNGYADLDALVLPSDEGETWGLVVNDAMTGGIPVILSDMVGCAPDLVRENETGYVFQCGNVPALASCIDRLLQRLESGHDFGTAVRARIKNYSIDKTVVGVQRAIAAALSA